ncbi:MAG: hypothetical protein IJ859_04020 [Synergistaceae bacterium]|nr:hypothetical protein [Synergistaceae bacterium]
MAQDTKISVLAVVNCSFYFIAEIVDRKINCEDVNFAALIFDEEDSPIEVPWVILVENFDNFSKILRENFSDTDIIFIVSDELSMFISSRVSRILKAAGIFCVGVLSFSWEFVHSHSYLVSIDRYEKSFDLFFHSMNLGIDEFQSIFECLTDFTKILAKITSGADITLEELTDAVQVIK